MDFGINIWEVAVLNKSNNSECALACSEELWGMSSRAALQVEWMWHCLNSIFTWDIDNNPN